MSIRKRGNRFIIDYYPEGRKGKRIQRVLPAGISETEAIELSATIQVENALSRGKDTTIASLFNQYLPWYKMHRSQATYQDLESVWKNHLEDHLGRLHPNFLNAKHVEFYQRSRKLEGGNNRTINKELAYFGGFLRWAERSRLIEPKMLRVEQLPYKRPLPIVLLPDEANDLIGALEQPYRAFVTALYTLGLRFSEAAGLTWENVDLTGRVLKVKQKGGTWKVLPINPRFCAELLEMSEENRHTGLVFRSKITKESIKDIRKALQRAAKKAGITKHVNPHLFRHSIATALMNKGVNLRVIQGYLGHADLATTQFYTHVAIESLKQAENAVLSLVGETAGLVEIPRQIEDRSLQEVEEVDEIIQ